MATDTKDQRLNLSLSANLLHAIDEWRRQQPDIPNRSEAARRLIEQSVTAKPAKASRKS